MNGLEYFFRRLDPDDRYLAYALREEPVWVGYYQVILTKLSLKEMFLLFYTTLHQDVHYVPLLSKDVTPSGFYNEVDLQSLAKDMFL